VFPVASSASTGIPGLYTSGSCAQGYQTFSPGSRLVFRITISDALPLGGTLTLSTCDLTANNTVLYLGTGCPAWAGTFNCLRGNDDASSVAGMACPKNPLASTIVHVATTRIYFVQLGSSSGADVVSGLAWRYRVASRSATGTRTLSRSPSRTRTRTATRSRSRSRKGKRRAV
jgi:hypothetical protein